MSRLPPKIEQATEGGSAIANTVRPIQFEGVTYALYKEHRTDQAGHIKGENFIATAVTVDGVLLWTTTYASFDFIAGLETDVQETFPVDFYREGNDLVIKFEGHATNNRIYRIMMSDGRERLKSYN